MYIFRSSEKVDTENMEEEVDNVAEFVNTREAHYLYLCKRDDLLRIAHRLGIMITASTKEAIQNEIMDYLRDSEGNTNTDDSDGKAETWCCGYAI